MVDITPIDRANKEDCKRMIDYFLSVNCTETVIQYTNKLYSLIEFDNQYLNPKKGAKRAP